MWLGTDTRWQAAVVCRWLRQGIGQQGRPAEQREACRGVRSSRVSRGKPAQRWPSLLPADAEPDRPFARGLAAARLPPLQILRFLFTWQRTSL